MYRMCLFSNSQPSRSHPNLVPSSPQAIKTPQSPERVEPTIRDTSLPTHSVWAALRFSTSAPPHRTHSGLRELSKKSGRNAKWQQPFFFNMILTTIYAQRPNISHSPTEQSRENTSHHNYSSIIFFKLSQKQKIHEVVCQRLGIMNPSPIGQCFQSALFWPGVDKSCMIVNIFSLPRNYRFLLPWLTIDRPLSWWLAWKTTPNAGARLVRITNLSDAYRIS